MEGGALRRQAGVAIKACSRKGQSSLAAHLGWGKRHGLFLKRTNLSNRQDAKVAKANKIVVSAGVETTSANLGALGVLAVNNEPHEELQEKTMGGEVSGGLRPRHWSFVIGEHHGGRAVPPVGCHRTPDLLRGRRGRSVKENGCCYLQT